MRELILASGSAIRKEMLERAGVTVQTVVSHVDEKTISGEDLWARARRLATEKAKAVAPAYPGMLVIGADQVGALLDDPFRELQKCQNEEEARRQLSKMQGRTHRFLSAATIVRDATVVETVEQKADVTFRHLSPATIDWYIASQEWKGSCGGYQIENRGAQLVSAVDGSLHAVLGLPLFPLLNALHALTEDGA